MWLHDHEETHDWAQLLTTQQHSESPDAISQLHITVKQQPKQQPKQQQLPQQQQQQQTTRRKASPPHTARAFFSAGGGGGGGQVHAPVLPVSGGDGSSDPDAAATTLLDLNDDEEPPTSGISRSSDNGNGPLRSAHTVQLAELTSSGIGGGGGNHSWSSLLDPSLLAATYPVNISSVFRGAWSVASGSSSSSAEGSGEGQEDSDQEDLSLWTRLGFPAAAIDPLYDKPTRLTKPQGFQANDGIVMFVLRAFPTWRPSPSASPPPAPTPTPAPTPAAAAAEAKKAGEGGEAQEEVLSPPALPPPPSPPLTARYSYLEGELVIRDGHYTTDRDLRFKIAGLYNGLDGRVGLFANLNSPTSLSSENEGPFWSSPENLQKFVQLPPPPTTTASDEPAAPPSEQQLTSFVADLSLALNRTRLDVAAWQRAKDRERYRTAHGEQREAFIQRRQAARIEAARAAGRPPPPTLDAAAAEKEADAAAAAEVQQNAPPKHYSDCALSIVFQLASTNARPTDSNADPRIFDVITSVPPRAAAPTAAAAADAPKPAPLRMNPVRFSAAAAAAAAADVAVVGSSSPSTSSSSSSSSAVPPLAVVSSTAESPPTVVVSAAAADADVVTAPLRVHQRRFLHFRTLQTPVQSGADSSSAAAAAAGGGGAGGGQTVGMGLADASLVDEATLQEQRAHLAMSGFIFSNASCTSPTPAPGDGAFSDRDPEDPPECHGCGFKLRIHATVLRIESFFSKAVNYAYFQSALALAQLFLLMRQMKASHTASASERISPYAIGVQALQDSYLCLFHCFTALSFQPLFNAFVVTAFLEFVLFSLFEMRSAVASATSVCNKRRRCELATL